MVGRRADKSVYGVVSIFLQCSSHIFSSVFMYLGSGRSSWICSRKDANFSLHSGMDTTLEGKA